MSVPGQIKSILKSIIIFAALIFAWLVYSSYDKKNTQEDYSFPEVQEPVFNFECQGKVYCSEMSSCDEAKFYLRNCPDTQLDGDGDGIPCESDLCVND